MTAPSQKYFRPGQYVFREGDPSRSLYLIKKGSVAVRKRKGSAFIELAKVYSNEVIGELSFFDKLPRSASAIAMTEVEVLEIPFETLEPFYDAVPDYVKTILASVAERFRKADDMIRRLQKETVVEDALEQEEKGDDAPTDFKNTAAVLAATAGVDFGGTNPNLAYPRPAQAKKPADRLETPGDAENPADQEKDSGKKKK